AVDDAGIPGGDGDVRQQAGHQARADSRAFHGGNHGLGAVHEVVDEIAGLLPHAGERVEVFGHFLDEVEIATGRECTVRTANDHGADVRIRIDVTPHVHQLAVHDVVGRVQAAGVFHGHPQNTFCGPRSEEHTSELQSREKLVCRLLLEKKKVGKTR